MTVNTQQEIPYPTKAPKNSTVGTWFSRWERGEVSSLSVRTIHNDLVPQFETSTAPGDRKDKLRDLISQQPTKNLTKEQRKGLERELLAHNQVSLLEEGEIGTFNTSPAQIEIVNPIPS